MDNNIYRHLHKSAPVSLTVTESGLLVSILCWCQLTVTAEARVWGFIEDIGALSGPH